MSIFRQRARLLSPRRKSFVAGDTRVRRVSRWGRFAPPRSAEGELLSAQSFAEVAETGAGRWAAGAKPGCAHSGFTLG